MKKEIVCPVCGGRGYVSWINSTETSCYSGSKTCPHCNGNGMREVDMTNADHIRFMTDDELAHLLANETFRIAKPCFDAFGYGLEEQVIYAKRLNWLKAPYKEGE